VAGACSILTSFRGTPAFEQLLRRPKEALAQHILVQRDLIRELKEKETGYNHDAVFDLHDELSYLQIKNAELEEALAELKDNFSQIVEGNVTRWDY
jgi:predicted nuclease with TOPRIM domain